MIGNICTLFLFFAIKMWKKVSMSDTEFAKKVIKDCDALLAQRKPIDQIKDDISALKVELIHIKNYMRKLEAREEIAEEKAWEAAGGDPVEVNHATWFWS